MNLRNLIHSVAHYNIIIALLFTSCTDELQNIANFDGDAISFKFDETKTISKSTRAAKKYLHGEAFQFENRNAWIIAAEEDLSNNLSSFSNSIPTRNDAEESDGLSEFHVQTYIYDGNGDWEDNFGMSQLYISETATKSSDIWETRNVHFWPGANYSLKFFAFTPISCGELNYAKRWPTIKYDASAQNEDLRIAANVSSDIDNEAVDDSADDSNNYISTLPGDYKKVVPLHFYHALSSVCVKSGDNLEAPISKIVISGVRTIGKHQFGSSEWTFISSSGEIYQEGSIEFSLDTPRMMIPQTLGDNAKITVTLENGDQLTASIAGKKWKMGRKITYIISKNKTYDEWALTLPDEISVSWMGGTTEQEIISYLRRVTVLEDNSLEEKIIEAPWTATPTGKASWLSTGISSGSGSTSGEPFSATVSKNNYTYTNTRNDNLAKATPVTGIYDLSTQGDTQARNTANCYIVNAPGTYKLPLVFGNGIVDGHENTEAWKPSYINGSASKLAVFKDYRRGNIATAYIYNQANNVPGDATLCWQDARDLVTNVRLDSDKHFLLFDVNQESICQGNALVALRDASGTIMWSWHIWVTDYVLGTDLKYVTNKGVPDNKDATITSNWFMPYNIGYCDDGIYKYSSRKVEIQVTQSYGGKTNTGSFTICQKEHVFHPQSSTYYQWGRKDPMLPGRYEEDGESYNPLTEYYQLNVYDKEQYYTNEKYKFAYMNSESINADLAISIQNPQLFFFSLKKNGNWCNWFPVNLWIGNNSGDVLKTVYDPSPVGFCVPSAKVFTGFTYNGEKVSVSTDDPSELTRAFDLYINSYISTKEEFVRNFGFTFYCKDMPSAGNYDISDGTISFPVIGYRPGDASRTTPFEVGNYSYTWSGNPDGNSIGAWYMIFGISENSIDLIPRTYGGSTDILPTSLANGFSVRPVKEY